MEVYTLLDKNNVSSEVVSMPAGVKPGGVFVPGEYPLGKKWTGEQWIDHTPVPSSVSKRQGRQQMIIMGVIDQVQPAIDAITDNLQRALVQSFWDDSSQYERLHPQMIQLATAIGLTEAELDDAFIAAAQL